MDIALKGLDNIDGVCRIVSFENAIANTFQCSTRRLPDARFAIDDQYRLAGYRCRWRFDCTVTRRRVRRDRKSQVKCGAHSKRRFDLDLTSRLLNESVNDGESQTGASPESLRRVERLEHPRLDLG